MPEGHTVRRLADRFAEEFSGRRLEVSSPQGRFADGAARLDGRVLERTDAAGKQMFLGFEEDRWLYVHLGLYGKWTFGAGEPPSPWGALRVRLVSEPFHDVRPGGADGRIWADLRGPTACEVVTPEQMDDHIRRLGPDPLRRDGRAALFAARVAARKVPIAALLMDQAVVAGIGNVYRAEALFRTRLRPDVPGCDLDPAVVAALWADLRLLLRDGVRRGSIVTTLPADRPKGSRRGAVRREAAHYVYRRTGLPCRVCGTPVATRELAGRNLFWCPACQA